MPPVLNMTELGIRQVCQYARLTRGSEYTSVKPEYTLIMPQYISICLNNAEYA